MHYNILIITLIILALSSCSEDKVTEQHGSPELSGISPDPAYIGDTVSISGKNLGNATENSFIIYNDSLSIGSFDCIKWTVSKVLAEIPLGASSGTFAVVANGDTSNRVELTINRLPPFEMVRLPASEFLMGSANGLDNESPVHEVRISRDFHMSVYEVTRLFYSAVTSGDKPGPDEKFLPAVFDNWMDAVLFCNKLSKIENLDTCYYSDMGMIHWDTLANGYRLPTEAEWEYACRAGGSGEFSNFDEVAEYAWFSMNSGLMPHPVGRKKKNGFGLYDIYGNMCEWCWDFYSEDYYGISPKNDPSGPDQGDIHVLRGGGWSSGAASIRAANRTFNDNNSECKGLRLVKTILE